MKTPQKEILGYGYFDKLLVDGYVNGENNNQNWRKRLDKNYKFFVFLQLAMEEIEGDGKPCLNLVVLYVY